MAVAIFTFFDSDLLEETDGIVGSLVFIRRMFFRQGRKGKTDVIFQCKQRRRGNGRKEKSKAVTVTQPRCKVVLNLLLAMKNNASSMIEKIYRLPFVRKIRITERNNNSLLSRERHFVTQGGKFNSPPLEILIPRFLFLEPLSLFPLNTTILRRASPSFFELKRGEERRGFCFSLS